MPSDGRRLAGRVVIVTGAGSGLGLGTVARLAEEGAVVVGLDLDPTAALGQGAADASVCDVCDAAAVDAAVASALARHGAIDGLATFAGVEASGTIGTVSPATWDRVLAVNVMGTVNAARAVMPAMLRAGRGAIALVSSQLATSGAAGCVAYATSKGAVNALCRSLAVDAGPAGIRVNAVAPGATRTPMMDRSFAGLPPDLQELSRGHHALGRFGEVAETAAAVAFLLSDDASFVTGAVLPVDGGWGAM